MRKLLLSAALVFVMLLQAEPSFAKKVCLQDNFGAFWEMKGGKIDKKTFTARYVIPGICDIPGYVTVITDVGGSQLGLVHTQTLVCNVVMYQILGDVDFNGSGNFDQLANGSIDGAYSLTKVGCNLIPITTLPLKEGAARPPALKQENEK